MRFDRPLEDLWEEHAGVAGDASKKKADGILRTDVGLMRDQKPGDVATAPLINGVFLLRNSAWTRRFFEEWLGMRQTEEFRNVSKTRYSDRFKGFMIGDQAGLLLWREKHLAEWSEHVVVAP